MLVWSKRRMNEKGKRRMVMEERKRIRGRMRKSGTWTHDGKEKKG